MKLRKRVAGLTLIEVSVSMVIMVLLISLASGVILAGLSIFWRNAEYRAAQNEGNAMYELLSGRIAYATSLDISRTGAALTGAYTEQIAISSDTVTLQRNGDAPETVFDAGTLHGHTVSVGCKKDADQAFLQLTVEIYRKDELLYTRSGVVPYLNFDTKQGAFQISDFNMGDPVVLTYSYYE